MIDCACSLSLVFLLSVIADVHNLQNVVVGAQLQRPHVDLDVLFQEVFSQLANLFGPCGAPHQSLTIRLYVFKEVEQVGIDYKSDLHLVPTASLQHISQ